MRVVVTGGGGYVGYHVGWALSQGGLHVTLLDLTPPDSEWAHTAPTALWDALPRGFWGGGEENPRPGTLEFTRGSVTNLEDLERHFEGATAVVHSASYGMSGKEQLSPHASQQEKVNVEGTREVIRAALTAKVQVLVYTSTYNVVFGGRQITGGDESLPLFPLHAHTDHYSRTKAIAEMLVLMADGKCGPPVLPPPGPHAPPQPCLRTCSLRMNGVLGLGEKQHTHRIMNAIRSGFLVLAYGRKDGLVDFIGIQNVVQAHVKALVALLREQNINTQHLPTNLPKIMCSARRQDSSSASGDTTSPSAASSTSAMYSCHVASPPSETSGLHTGNTGYKCTSTEFDLSPAIISPSVTSTYPASSNVPIVSGQAFFISDSTPVSYYEYFRPLFEGLGYTFPAYTLPLWLIIAVAHLQEITYCLVHKFLPFTPLVTPAEAYKSGVTHYCSSRKAVEAFNYCPTRPNDLRQILDYYKGQGCTRSHTMGLVSLLPLALFLILPIFSLLVVL